MNYLESVLIDFTYGDINVYTYDLFYYRVCIAMSSKMCSKEMHNYPFLF